MPRPAMFVAIVTAPRRPAWATIAASRSWYFAFSTTCWTRFFLSSRDSISLFSIETVPTSTGWPCSWQSWISSTTAFHFSGAVR